jgi:hypothetical protein
MWVYLLMIPSIPNETCLDLVIYFFYLLLIIDALRS